MKTFENVGKILNEGFVAYIINVNPSPILS